MINNAATKMTNLSENNTSGSTKQSSLNYSAALVSAQNRVQSPFIIVKIGDYTLGDCQKKETKQRLTHEYKVKYPNFIDSLRVKKVNGTVNTYTLQLTYVIQAGDDPNLIDKILSSVSDSRLIYFTYGDWEVPDYIYREEEAIITKVSTSVSFESSKITYTITAVSNSLTLQSTKKSYPKYTRKKPSDILKKLLRENSDKILDVFTGMKDMDLVETNNLIADDDQEVDIPAKPNISVLDYISYLVGYMKCNSDVGNVAIKKNIYYWYVCDDINNKLGGPYFMVSKVSSSSSSTNTYNTYEVDVGYPNSNFVSAFSVKSDESWSILYNYSKKLAMDEYSYKINNDGTVARVFDPEITTSNRYYTTTEADRTWWSKMTMFPVSATLTIKGLLRPAMLMQHVKINAYFYGQKHTASGLYVISQQEDSIDASGYKTELSLIRISGDDDLTVA